MTLSIEQKRLVQSTFVKVALIADRASELFYKRLFEIDPTTKPLFAKTDMYEQGRKLMQMIGSVVGGLDRLEEIVPHIQMLGKRHLAYGVKKEQYATVGQALIWTLEQGLGSDFTPEVKEERDDGNYCQGDVEYRSQVDHRVARLRNECL